MKKKLTKSEIDKLPFAEHGKQTTIHDTTLPGFALRIGATSKTFIVYKRVARGAPKRVTLGKYGHLTVDQARAMAQKALAELSGGIDVIAAQKAAQAKAKKAKQSDAETLRWLLDEYKKEQIIGLKGGKEGTLHSLTDTSNFFNERKLTLLRQVNGEWVVDKPIVLSDWLDRPFRSITADEVLERFDLFARGKPQKLIGGELKPISRTHQIAFKFLSTAYNFIIPRLRHQGEVFSNPADILTIYKRWKPSEKRKRFLDFETAELAKWWNALEDYRTENTVASDYILFSLLQAARSIEVNDLRWSQVDLEKRRVNYDETKNGNDYAFPLSTLAAEILERRKKAAINEFVFGYEASKTGRMPKDSKNHYQQLVKRGAKLISSHDLRRTWASTAHMLDINERTINYLLKHTISDVNEHYFVRNEAKLKGALQQVEDYLLQQVAKFTPKANGEEIGDVQPDAVTAA
ncbi:integrase family protein [Paraburkholderia bryophila]|uniref:tyrosine-type recombinase/integrase n=1 Tax=Paraburkholderia bryophila TaxID=420952 RepID=UPI00234B00CF|nr:integrase family protein [Paraburkholderia bryophila]WCM23136.1 integrase family protein [Paraburkholderia bryophila]